METIKFERYNDKISANVKSRSTIDRSDITVSSVWQKKSLHTDSVLQFHVLTILKTLTVRLTVSEFFATFCRAPVAPAAAAGSPYLQQLYTAASPYGLGTPGT